MQQQRRFRSRFVEYDKPNINWQEQDGRKVEEWRDYLDQGSKRSLAGRAADSSLKHQGNWLDPCLFDAMRVLIRMCVCRNKTPRFGKVDQRLTPLPAVADLSLSHTKVSNHPSPNSLNQPCACRGGITGAVQGLELPCGVVRIAASKGMRLVGRFGAIDSPIRTLRHSRQVQDITALQGTAAH